MQVDWTLNWKEGEQMVKKLEITSKVRKQAIKMQVDWTLNWKEGEQMVKKLEITSKVRKQLP